MAGFRPVALFGLNVPSGEDPVRPFDLEAGERPYTFRITMAAIDPTTKPGAAGQTNGDVPHRTTLKMIRVPDMSDSDDDDEGLNLEDMLSDEEDDDSDEEAGPSDPERGLKARRKAAAAKLKEELANGGDGMELDGVNGVKNKGKGKVTRGEEDSDTEEQAEEFVLCTLDPEKNYQQTLDITIGEDEEVLFQVSGTHNICLTGNILVPERSLADEDDMYDSEDEEDGFDFPPDADEDYDLPDDEDENDELDDLDDPMRITELHTDDEDEHKAPTLVKAEPVMAKGKNKRAAESTDEDTPTKPTTDSLLAKSFKPAESTVPTMNGDVKLSKNQKKQLKKKLKDNAGNPVDITVPTTKSVDEDVGVKANPDEALKSSPAKSDKKVQFAKTLVQGPSSTSSPVVPTAKDEATRSMTEKALETTKTGASKPSDATKATADANDKPPKASLGVKTVHGVTVDDRELGTGPAAKKGDKVSMRYIGKLEKDKRVFDSNKSGKPFTFKLGAGEVIKGWDIGVTGMSVGGTRRIIIPAHLAYGSKAQPTIPANSTLMFDLKLLEIK